MVNHLAAKLGHFKPLARDDVAVLDRLCADVETFRAKRDLIKEGDRPRFVFLLLEGWACRYKLLPDGERQIMAFLVPGDLCDVRVALLHEMDHSIGLLTDTKVALIPHDAITHILDERPALAQALWWSTLTDEAVLREWLVNIGRRDARQRIAHLLVELMLRLRAVGLASETTCRLPITQCDIADATGLTPVHVNRVLQQLRSEGLIALDHKQLYVANQAELMAVAQFSANYLHLQEERL